MRKRSRFGLFCGVAVLLPATALYADATFKILAAGHNPTCLRPGSPHFGDSCGINSECDSTPGQGDGLCVGTIVKTNTLNVEVGDIIVAEVYISDWAGTEDDAIKTYQFQVDRSKFFGDCAGINGYNWNRQEDCDRACSTDADCTEGEACIEGICYPADHDPFSAVFIDDERTDYLFKDRTAIGAIEICGLRFGGVLITPPYILDDGSPKYLGTMVLTVNPGTTGTHQVELLAVTPAGTLPTFARDPNNGLLLPFNLEPLTLIVPGPECVGGCDLDPVEPADPPHCSIDARQTSNPDGVTFLPGSDSMDITFVSECTAVMDVVNFSIRQVPNDTPPVISSVDWDDVTKTATVNFDRRISPREWTCVSYNGRDPNPEFCTGYLPADVDSNGASNASDILNVINNLNGVVDPAYLIWQCDVDRSGVCGASDILRVIDLLNGASEYDVWLGQTIETCPDPAP